MFNKRLNDIKTNGKFCFQIKLEIYDTELLHRVVDELYFEVIAINGAAYLLQSIKWTNAVVVFATDEITFKQKDMFFFTESNAFRLSLFMNLIKPLKEKSFIKGCKYRNGNQLIYFNNKYEFSSQGEEQEDDEIGWTYLHFL
jgi:hypothetical protein